MQTLLTKFAPLGWGEKVFTEAYLTRICRRERVKIVEYPLTASPGFYYACKGRHFITIDSRKRGVERLYILLHELAHYFLHVPAHATAAHYFRLRPGTKQEHEAEVFATVALIPEWKLRRLLLTTRDEWEHGITEEIVQDRLKVLELYGI